jgi:outer membrane lipoprotein-sorting protein
LQEQQHLENKKLYKNNYIFIISLFFYAGSVFADKNKAEEILKNADEVRNPSKSFSMIVNLVNDNEISKFEVKLQGNTKTLIKTIEPPRDRGRNFLMLEEDMWAYVPNLKRAVRVSLSQKLSGQAANGDISRTRWFGDYEPSIESENQQKWTLNLVASKKGLTYEKIKLVVAKKTFFPLEAEYQTKSGKSLKIAKFEDYGELAGKQRPRKIVITDAIKTSEKSEIRVVSMKPEEFPEALFNQSNLQ